MSGPYKSPKIYSRMLDKNDFVTLDDNLITILGVVFGALPLVLIIIYYMYKYYKPNDNSRQNLV